MRTRSQREDELESLSVAEIIEQHAQALGHPPVVYSDGSFGPTVGPMIREILEREFPPGSTRPDNSDGRFSKSA